MARTNTATNADLHAERESIQAKLAVLGDDPSDEARDLVARAKALLKEREQQAAPLRQALTEIDQTFRVSAKEKAEREQWEQEQRIRAEIDQYLEARTAMLAAVDEYETLLHKFHAKRKEILAHNRVCKEITSRLFEKSKGAHDEGRLVETLSAYQANASIEANAGLDRFGRNCHFIRPPQPVHVNVNQVKKTWRQREEDREGWAVDRILSKMPGGANAN